MSALVLDGVTVSRGAGPVISDVSLRVAGGEDVSDDLVALADAVRGPVAPAPHGPVGTPDAAPRGTSRAGGHDPRDAGGRAAGRPAERDRHLHVIRNSDD